MAKGSGVRRKGLGRVVMQGGGAEEKCLKCHVEVVGREVAVKKWSWTKHVGRKLCKEK